MAIVRSLSGRTNQAFRSLGVIVGWWRDRTGNLSVSKSDVGLISRMLMQASMASYAVTNQVVLGRAFANNHFAGHGPETIKLFSQLWDARD